MRKMNRKIGLLAMVGIFSVLPLAGHAAPPPADALSKCMNAAKDQIEEIDCIDAENARHDAKLNKAYKKLVAAATKQQKEKLQEAQRAWMKMRDADCEYFNVPDGGTNVSLNLADCVMTHTKQRAEYLEVLAR
jgi:uncharacterized protein YecT (DUF1311 family)